MNYREVEIEPGLVAKISPMRLTPENLDLCDRLGSRLENNQTLFLSEARPITEALRRGLVEFHTPDEADHMISRLHFSSQIDSVFMSVVRALLDSDTKVPDEDAI